MRLLIYSLLLCATPLAWGQCATQINAQSVDAVRVFSPSTACTFHSQTFRIKLAADNVSTQEVLFIAYSNPGERFNAFVLRSGKMLTQYSAVTGFEACGVFAGSVSQYGMIATTNRSSFACVNNHAVVPNQMISLKRTIHSHGASSGVYTTSDNALLKHNHAVNTKVYADLYHFSTQDLKFSGYLATPNGVLYHNKASGSVVPVDVD